MNQSNQPTVNCLCWPKEYLFYKLRRNLFANRELRNINLSLEHILSNKLHRETLTAYFEMRKLHHLFASIKQYEFCMKLWKDTSLLEDQNIVNDLFHICPTYAFEFQIMNEIDHFRQFGADMGIKIILNSLAKTLTLEMENSMAFRQFQQQLLLKHKCIKDILKNQYDETHSDF